MSDRVVFIHIFKCAGTALIAPIQFHYRLEKVKPYYSLNIPPSHPKHWDNLTQQERDAIWFFSGHLRDHNTPEEIRRICGEDCHYITVLRDPVERVISTYYYLKDKKCANGPLYHLLNDYSLEDCLGMMYTQYPFSKVMTWWELLQNHQTRILSGNKHHYQQKAMCYWNVSERDFYTAAENLTTYSFVGNTETLYQDWNKKLKPLLRNIDIPPHLLTQKANATPKKEATSEEVRQRIKEKNDLDYRLLKLQEQGR